MRRSASEIIRNLERRIARLERTSNDSFALAEEVMRWAKKNEGRRFNGRVLEVHTNNTGSEGDEGLVFVGRGESYEAGNFVMCNYLGDHGIETVDCILMRDFQDAREWGKNVSGMTSAQIIEVLLSLVSKA